MSKISFGFLDNDFYQFTMSQVIWEHYNSVKVRYRFRNRTFAVPLASRIAIEIVLDAIEQVIDESVPTDADILYLENTGLFDPAYLEALRYVSLSDLDMKVGEDNGHLVITYEGPWWKGVFWETPLLYTISKLYYARFGSGEEGLARLYDKIGYLEENPQLRFAEMGTRRRYHGYWQRLILDQMAQKAPNSIVGTSNVHFAREFDLKPIGTMAHQMFMVAAALEVAESKGLGGAHPDINGAQQLVLDRWEAVYSDFPHMFIFLPDTYGTEFFLAGMSKERMNQWSGVRQDSGDPLDICARIIRWMKANGIDPMTKKILPSDGLDLRRMSLLHDEFGDQTQLSFGVGTNWTNDCGYEPLSIVVKPDAVIFSDGSEEPCVKLSDNPVKATGDPESIDLYKKLVGYSVDSHEERATKY